MSATGASTDEFAEEMEGQRRNSKLYSVRDNLHVLEKKYNGLLIVKCTSYKKPTSCTGRAHLEEVTLRVVDVRGEHTCNQDLNMKIRIKMESKMKQLATTTGDSLRKIFDDVSLENPAVAAEIPFPRLEAAMRFRRSQTTPINPTNFTECVELLMGAVTYNKHLVHSILRDEEVGAMLFATEKGLDTANSPDVKVGMTDATFQCCPRREHTGIYQMLIFHVMRYGSAIPILHVPMTHKSEDLYNEVLEWLKNRCPQLNPHNISVDFEVGEMNAVEYVFGIIPTGCDFHYNNALLAKAGKKGLKVTIKRNKEFGKYFHQLMALNHLPADKIEPTFRELCAKRIALSSKTQKARESFERYWERFWLNKIGVDRLTVFKAPLRTNNHCENYHSKLPTTIGVRPNFWIFIRQLNRLLEVNDINLARLESDIAVNRSKKGPSANDKKIAELVKRLETGQPRPITPLGFVEAIAHFQTSKYQDRGDNDSDSDSDIEEGEDEEESDRDAHETGASAEPDNNTGGSATECKICYGAEINALLLPCKHTTCSTCAEKLKREKRGCGICRARIRNIIDGIYI